jgi:hypothetical protein
MRLQPFAQALLAAALTLTFTALPFSALAQQRTIDVDVTQVQGKLDRMFNLSVGAGRANEGLRADWQQQLAEIRRDAGFRYIRFHGLLSDDMGVYRIDAQGKEQVNFQYIDALFDYLLSIGIKPFVELGFMPNAMASGTRTIFWWRGNVTPPRDYGQWERLIEASRGTGPNATAATRWRAGTSRCGTNRTWTASGPAPRTNTSACTPTRRAPSSASTRPTGSAGRPRPARPGFPR